MKALGALAAALVAALAVVGLFPDELGITINAFLIAVVGAVGLNVLTGTAGQISLGQAGFLAVGAYIGVIVGNNSGFALVPTLIAAILAGAFVGLVVGVPSSRLKGLYAVLGTLALSFIIMYATNEYEYEVEQGAGAILPIAELFGWSIDSDVEWFWALFALAAAAVALHWRLLGTHTGRAWVAIRDGESTAPILGVDVRRMKLLAYMISGGIVAFAGAVGGYYSGAVSSGSFTLELSILYLAMIVVGGMGRPGGAVAGAAIFMLLPIYLQRILGDVSDTFGDAATISYWRLAIEGLILILILWRLPHGIAPAVGDLLRRARGGARPRAAEPALAVAGAGGSAPAAPASAPAPPAVAGNGAPPAAARSLLEVERLSARYGRSGAVLHEVGLQLGPGEVLAVLGPNGAGKTTLLRTLTGFTPAEPGVIAGGRVTLDGRDVTRLSPFRRAREGIVMVAEREKVFNELTARENIELAVPAGEDTRACVAHAVGLFPRLEPRLDGEAALLSGGERQMLAIARAMTLRPRVLLIDETTLGLAPAVAEDVMRSVRDLAIASEMSVLLVEQNAALALGVADRFAVLSRGRIVETGVADRGEVARLHGAYFGTEEVEGWPEPSN